MLSSPLVFKNEFKTSIILPFMLSGGKWLSCDKYEIVFSKLWMRLAKSFSIFWLWRVQLIMRSCCKITESEDSDLVLHSAGINSAHWHTTGSRKGCRPGWECSGCKDLLNWTLWADVGALNAIRAATGSVVWPALFRVDEKWGEHQHFRSGLEYWFFLALVERHSRGWVWF